MKQGLIIFMVILLMSASLAFAQSERTVFAGTRLEGEGGYVKMTAGYAVPFSAGSKYHAILWGNGGKGDFDSNLDAAYITKVNLFGLEEFYGGIMAGPGTDRSISEYVIGGFGVLAGYKFTMRTSAWLVFRGQTDFDTGNDRKDQFLFFAGIGYQLE